MHPWADTCHLQVTGGPESAAWISATDFTDTDLRSSIGLAEAYPRVRGNISPHPKVNSSLYCTGSRASQPACYSAVQDWVAQNILVHQGSTTYQKERKEKLYPSHLLYTVEKQQDVCYDIYQDKSSYYIQYEKTINPLLIDN